MYLAEEIATPFQRGFMNMIMLLLRSYKDIHDVAGQVPIVRYLQQAKQISAAEDQHRSTSSEPQPELAEIARKPGISSVLVRRVNVC